MTDTVWLSFPCGCALEALYRGAWISEIRIRSTGTCTIHQLRRPYELEERCDVAARLAGMRLTPSQRRYWRYHLGKHPRESGMTPTPPPERSTFVAPCSCRYYPYGVRGPYDRWPGGSVFKVDPACWHHGDARRFSGGYSWSLPAGSE